MQCPWLLDLYFGFAHPFSIEKPVTRWNWDPSEERISSGAKYTFGRQSPAVMVMGTCMKQMAVGELCPSVPHSNTYQLRFIVAAKMGFTWSAVVGTKGWCFWRMCVGLGALSPLQQLGARVQSCTAPRCALARSPASCLLSLQRSVLEFKLN